MGDYKRIISHEELLQYFYNNQPNRKQLSRFWLSQWFSTAETIPDIMLLESRGAIKTPHMIKESVCNLKQTATCCLNQLYTTMNPKFESPQHAVVNQHIMFLRWNILLFMIYYSELNIFKTTCFWGVSPGCFTLLAFLATRSLSPTVQNLKKWKST